MVGGAFSFDVGFEADRMIFLYYGSLAIVAWKSTNIFLGDARQK